MFVGEYAKVCNGGKEGLAARVGDPLGCIAIKLKFILVGEADHWLVVDVDGLDISTMTGAEYF